MKNSPLMLPFFQLTEIRKDYIVDVNVPTQLPAQGRANVIP